jgi:hypothetical protein
VRPAGAHTPFNNPRAVRRMMKSVVFDRKTEALLGGAGASGVGGQRDASG